MFSSRRNFIAAALVGPLRRRVEILGARQPADLTFLTIAEARAQLARREISPAELTEAYLERIARVNPEINAFVTVTAARARSDALRRGAGGSLGGIPIAHKDLFDTAGIRTSAGSRLFESRIPTKDADLVARLLRAGTVLLGKTNTHELGGGVTTINPFYGTTRNPVDPSRIPGGSSGGSAAAVAARLAAAATGSDTGGSVRIPASLCGCVGFKPTFGRLSTAGLLGACPTFDHVGFLTRSAEDAELLFAAARGVGRPPGGMAQPRGRPIAVGVARAFFFDNLHADVARAMERAIERFRSLGAVVRDHNLPLDATTMSRVFDPIVVAEIWSRYGQDWKQRSQAFSPGFAEFFKTTVPTAAELAATHRARRAFQEQVTAVFNTVDVVLTPTVPVTAPPIAGPIDGALILRNTWPFNAARTPAISIPCGSDSTGLPIGLQLAGRPGDDETVLRVARMFERS